MQTMRHMSKGTCVAKESIIILSGKFANKYKEKSDVNQEE